MKKETYKEAYFAGGCFWCIESAMRGLDGVIEATSGFAGGDEKNPSYREVAYSKTSHREAVKVVYDPEIIDYINILSQFWRQIDPTDREGQFADRGFHYTTAIYYSDEYQKQIALASKKYLENLGHFEEEIVTEILPFTTFYRAEEHHQNYSEKESCHYNLYKKGSGRAGYIEKVWGYDENSLINEEDYENIKKKYYR